MATLALEKMSVTEKIHVMESIWDDLCGQAESVALPPWHREVLAEREAAVQRGEDEFEDWEAAKRNIKKMVDVGSGSRREGDGNQRRTVNERE